MRRASTLAAVLVAFLFLPASASGGMEQTVRFTSTPPSPSIAGGIYIASATSSAGIPATFGEPGGVCSFAPGTEVAELPRTGSSELPEREHRASPAIVHFDGVGTCTLIAGAPGNEDYDEAEPVEQTFTVARNPSEVITFTSEVPGDAVVGSSYGPKVRSSASIGVGFSVPTPSVCQIVDRLNPYVSFLAPGTCTIDARQRGISEAEPPEAEQSFRVKGVQHVAFTSEPPINAVAGGSYEVSATASWGPVVTVAVSGACSTSVPPLTDEETLGRGPWHGRVEEAHPLPATVYLVGAGICRISTNSRAGNAEYEYAPPVSQSFEVAKDLSEKLAFISHPPSRARVGGSYDPSVQSSAAINVSFSTSTPSVCRTEPEGVKFFGRGICTVEAGQQGLSSTESPEAQQSFVVTGRRRRAKR